VNAPNLRVDTTEGPVQGLYSEFDNNVRVFRGIPFAAPPIAEHRWKPPVKPATRSDLYDATRFSASSIQPVNCSEFVWCRDDFEVSEDCLYLNIWSPKEAEGLPVMVWFHGGSHTSGQAHSRIFDGTTLAQQDVVLVTANYRLGVFGFLAHQWLADESAHNSAGNYGLLDNLAALNWVHDNIHFFGGDPDNVTVFGQSAGSQSICSLLTSPLAGGLFHKAIGQSASSMEPHSKQDMNGLERGGRLVESLGAASLESLRDIDAAVILDAAVSSGWEDASRIVIDGWVLPDTQASVYRRAAQIKVPLMLGFLGDEGVKLIEENKALTDEQLDQFLERVFGDQASALKRLYGRTLQTPGAVQHGIATDIFMAFGMRRWAEYSAAAGSDTYLYFMDHVPPAFHIYMPDNPFMTLEGGPRSAGAYHSGDLAFVFGNTDKVGVHWKPEDHQLAAMMVRYWTNFARQGNPNDAQLPEWRRFSLAERETMRLNTSAESVSGIRAEALDLIALAFPM